MEKIYFHHALKVLDDFCYGCTHCMDVCPTQAIRVMGGKARIINNRCIDCGECLRSCPAEAIVVQQDDFNKIFNYKVRALIIPSVFVGQFPENILEEQIYSVLYELGFTHIYEAEQQVEFLNQAIVEYIEQNAEKKPLISSFCPAVIRLIQVRFTSLCNNLILLKPPLDISATFFKKHLIDSGIDEKELGLFYITPCAAKIAAVRSPVGEEKSLIDGVINMNYIYNKVLKRIKNETNEMCYVTPQKFLTKKGILWPLTGGEAENIPGRCFAIDGIRNIIDFLEKIENEDIVDIDFLEMRACNHSCAGGVLTVGNRFLTVERMRKRSQKYFLESDRIMQQIYSDLTRYRPFLNDNKSISEIRPRSMLTLDDNIAKALQKMQQSIELRKNMPLIDCGVCGAPYCTSLAEDIVKGEAEVSQCIFYLHRLLNDGQINLLDAKKMIEKIWGNDFFEKQSKKIKAKSVE
jgi:iron only hydrogenase large subunit-like protein